MYIAPWLVKMTDLHTLTSYCVPQFHPAADWRRFCVSDHCALLTFDGDLFALEIVHVAQQYFLPVAAVANETQVGERPFRRSHLFLYFGQKITYSKHKQA